MQMLDLLMRHQALKGYGRTAAEILETCRLFAQAEKEWPAEDVYEFKEEAGINPKFWPKLIAIHNETRFKEHLQILPAHINSLYELTKFNYRLFKEAINLGIVTPKTSARALQYYRKAHEDPAAVRRFQEWMPPEVTIRVNWHEITEKSDEIKKALQALGKLPEVQLLERYSSSAKETLIPVAKLPESVRYSIIEEMMADLKVFYGEAAAVDLKRYNVKKVDDFCNLSLKAFKEFLVRIVGSIEEYWQRCGKVNQYRLALEICNSDSYPERDKIMKLMVRLSRDHGLQEVTDNIIELFDEEVSVQVSMFSK
jgi:hypothetical protein